MWAACEVACGVTAAPVRGNPVFADLKRRLEAALDAPARASLAAVAGRLLAQPAAIDGAGVLAAAARAALRAGILVAQDPAVAIATARARTSGIGPLGLAAELMPGVPFAVSAGFLALRRKLQVGVRS